jgi:hypothetical protein
MQQRPGGKTPGEAVENGDFPTKPPNSGRCLVARMERSAIRDDQDGPAPDFATLHPGYERFRPIENWVPSAI